MWYKRGSEGRVNGEDRTMKPAIIASFIGFFVFMIILTSSVSAETIDGSRVYVDNAKLFFEADPHTLKFGDDRIRFRLMSKQFSGEIDIGFGFDTDVIKPKSVDAFVGGEWLDLTSNFNKIEHDYGGMDSWYFTKKVNINSMQMYSFGVNFDVVGTGSGKYWVCAKPSSQTISEAIASDNFLCLDPWFDVSYLFRRAINTTCETCLFNATTPIPINDTLIINGSNETFWCNVKSNSTDQFVYFNNHTDYICANDTVQLPLFVDFGNGTDFENPFEDAYIVHTINMTAGSIAYDESGNGFHGTLSGPSDDLRGDGRIANGFYLPVNADILTISAAATAAHAIGSMSIWFRPDTTMNSSQGIGTGGSRIYRYDGGSTGDVYFPLGDGKLTFDTWCSSGTLISTTSEWIAGEWYAIDIRWNSSEVIVMVNGIIEDICPPHASVTGQQIDSMIIGNRAPSWSGALGMYDNFIFRSGANTSSYDDLRFQYEMIQLFPFDRIGAIENRTSVTTSLLGVNFDIDDFEFASTSYVEGVDVQFNTSQPSTNFYVLSAMNIERLTGVGTRIITTRIKVDGVTLIEEPLRTIDAVGDIGVAAVSPFNFTLASGEHNITMEFKSSGTGQVGISNINLNLHQLLTNENKVVRGDIQPIFYQYTSPLFSPEFSWLITKTVESGTYLAVKQTVSKTLGSSNELGFRFNDTTNNELSPSWFRLLTDSSDIGSVVGVAVQESHTGTINYSLDSKSSQAVSLVTVNGSLLNMDLSGSAGLIIPSFQLSNNLSNESSPLSLGGGTHLLATTNVTTNTGDSFYVSYTSSFNSVSGSQTPTYFINSSNSSITCLSEKERFLSNNADIGNAFDFYCCTNMDSGETYDLNLYVTVSGGETIEQIDESFNGFEIKSFPITIGNIPPIPNIITDPNDGDIVSGVDTIAWLSFDDPNGGVITYNISLFNLDGSFNTSIGTTTSLSLGVNWNNFEFDNYTLSVEGCDPTSLCSNSTIQIETVELVFEVPNSATFCSSDVTLYTRIVGHETNVINGIPVENITIDEVFFNCPTACDNTTLWNLGQPGCTETDLQWAVIIIIIVILGGLMVWVVQR